MSEECSIADSKQTDFGFGVDARAEDPLRPDPPCPVRLFCMTLSWVRMGSPLSPYPVLPARLSHMTLSWDGWDLPCWLPASPLFYLRQPDAIQSWASGCSAGEFWQDNRASIATNTFSGEFEDPWTEAIPCAWRQSILFCPQVGMEACWVAWTGRPGGLLQGKGLGEAISCIWSCDTCLVGGSMPCSSGISDVSRPEVSGISRIGRGSGGRGSPFLFWGRSSGGIGCLGAATWRISLSGTQIGESASCWKTQAYPWPLVNNGSGPLHCPERRSFHFTSSFAFCCSGHQWWSSAGKSTFKLFITKRACCKIW